MSLKDLYERKREAYAVCRGMLDAAAKDGRQMTAEENEQYTKAEAALDAVDQEIAAEEQQIRRQQKLANVAKDMEKAPPLVLPALAGTDGANTKPDNRSLAEKISDATAEGMTRQEALSAVVKTANKDQAKLQNQAMRQYLLTGQISSALLERAALRVDNDATGGFLVTPERFVAQLIMDLDRQVQIRQFATVIPVTDAESLGAPALENDMGDPTWTTELQVGAEDSTLSFNKRKLTPHAVARYIKVSKDLLKKSVFNVESIVRERLAYKFGYVQETAFMTGSGSGEPLGIFTASNAGISTARDVSTDNTNSTITTDGLINCKYSLSSAWLVSDSLRWIFHRDIVKFIRKLKDGNGTTIWQPGLAADRPNTILDVPVTMSEFAPSTMTTGLYVGIIGDFRNYWIADQMGLEIQAGRELYMMTNQDVFLGRLACDGMPVLENAFARVTMG